MGEGEGGGGGGETEKGVETTFYNTDFDLLPREGAE